ncbi:MAG: hypothetical protein AAFR14_01920 [Bacteroidota bacterium]
MKFAFLALLGLILLQTACRADQDTPEGLLYQQVMDIHDEVMPQMKDIHQLRKKLRKIEGAASNESIQDMLLELQKADDQMMDWMADFKRPKEGDSNAMSYLNTEMSKIEKVRDNMLSTIANGQEILQSYEK